MRSFPITILAALAAFPFSIQAAPRKAHVVVLGAARGVPYSTAGDPAGAAPGEDSLRIRALVVDGAVKEWTTGDAHDLTDRSFVVRRAIKLNDTLPGEKVGPGESPAQDSSAGKHALTGGQSHWVWQRGPWLLVDRVTGHVIALKLPDYDPGVSQASWFRDYAAYCGLTASGKSLYAVVAQVAARKPVLARKLSAFDAASRGAETCGPPDWQRQPLRITFHPAGREPVGFDIVPGSAVLVEDAGDDAEAPAAAQAKPN